MGLKKFVASMFGVFFKACSMVIGIDRLYGVLKQILPEVENRFGAFITYHQRPIATSNVHTKCDPLRSRPKTAIILQGPVIKEFAFTEETIRLYRKHFPDDPVILSTWENEGDGIVRLGGEVGVHIVTNKVPSYSGQSNINLQIVSSRSGVEKAMELGAEYILKTRTDQRIYAPDVLHFLFNMTEVFPARGGNGTQKKRIVGVNLNTFRYRMYGLSDMVIYGHVDDMNRFWRAPLDNRVFSEEFAESRGKSLRIFANWRVCEVYLATEFLREVGHALEWTLGDSWKAFSDHFCVVDKEQLDLFWLKYNRLEYRSINYDEFNAKQELTFRDWLNVYNDLGNKPAPEHFLDIPL